MKELGMVLAGCVAFFCFFAFIIYPDLEYKGYPSTHTCTGECYEEYVRIHGTTVDILRAQQALAAGDPFSDIRSLWSGCAACHGADGGGGIGPMLAGQSSSDIISKLTTYKNNGTIGSQSALMWGQAAMLSEKDIETIGEFIQAGLPGE
jgi:cytochrome c553